MEAKLSKNFVGEFVVNVANLSCTTLARPTSKLGLEKVEESVRSKGWLSQFAPSVLIPREAVGDGELTDELALTINARVLDGNHRVVVFKKVFGESSTLGSSMATIASWCSRRFLEKVQRSRSGFTWNSATHPTRSSSPTVCAKPPGDSTLTKTKRAVTSLCREAFDTIRELSEREANDNKVDSSAITFAYLSRGEFMQLKSKPTEQVLCLPLLARFKGTFSRNAKADDFQSIAVQASGSAEIIDSLARMIPREEWSARLNKMVSTFAYEKHNCFELLVKPHLIMLAEELKTLASKLPEGQTLDADIVSVVKQKPLVSIRTVIHEDPNLRPYLLKWQDLYQQALNKVNMIELQQGGVPDENGGPGGDGTPSEYEDLGGGDSGNPSDGESDDENDGGGQCVPPASCGNLCVECLMTHVGHCADASLADSNQAEMDKRRRCKDCEPPQKRSSAAVGKRKQGSQRDEGVDNSNDTSGGSGEKSAKKRGRKATKTLFPDLSNPASRSLGSSLQASRSENAVLHDLLPLSLDTTTAALVSLPCQHRAMLAVVSIAANRSLLNDTTAANDRLWQVMAAVHDGLHPSGTIALFVPHPWHRHLRRLTDALQKPGTAMVVEENYLVLQYATKQAGRPAAAATNHLCRNLDCVLIAHNKPTDGKDFTCNPRVTVDDVYGQYNSGSVTAPLPLMSNIPYGGADKDIPDRALQFLINRYSRPGDTVLIMCGESNHAIEIALSRARRVEVFLADETAKDSVGKRIEDAFLTAYKEGKFKAMTTPAKEILVGPQHLPQALNADTTPEKVKQAIAAAVETCF